VVVAGGGLAALLLYRYVDVGRLGSPPDMYEPFWFTDKTRTAVAQAAATAAALVLVVVGWSPRQTGRQRPGSTPESDPSRDLTRRFAVRCTNCIRNTASSVNLRAPRCAGGAALLT